MGRKQEAAVYESCGQKSKTAKSGYAHSRGKCILSNPRRKSAIPEMESKSKQLHSQRTMSRNLNRVELIEISLVTRS